MVKVSVIVPVFNVEVYLPRCLESIACQTLREIEAIFVDDGSTDGSGAQLDEFAQRDDRFHVIHQANAGAGAARNAGLDRAIGEYLFFFDPDDACTADMLAGMYARAKRSNADVVVAGKTLVDSSTGRCLEQKGFSRDMWRLPQPFAPVDVGTRLFTFAKSVPWDKLFRRSFVLEKGLRFQNVRRCNDVFFTGMALALAERIALDPHACYRYSVNRADSLQSDKDKAPFAVIEAYGALEEGLRAKGVWTNFAEAYLAVYLLSVAFNLAHLVEPGNVDACWRKLRNELLRLKECDGLDGARLRTPWQRAVYGAVVDSSSPERVVDLMRRGKPPARLSWLGRVKGALARALPFAVRERWKRFAPDFRRGGFPQSVFAAAFLAALAVFGLPLAKKALHTPVRALAEKFPLKRWFVELNGGAHRAIGRRFCNAVYRAPGGILLSEQTRKGCYEPQAEAMAEFSKWLAGKNAAFIYVQAPAKIDMEGTMLPAPLVNRENARADDLMSRLAEKGIRAIDLRAMLTATPKNVERFFYHTDHHWNNDAVFKVFGVLAPEIARAVGDDPAAVAPYVDASSWKRTVWPQCFAGTKTRRTGLLFGGKDDLIVYVPCFKAEMTMDILSKDIRLSGDFRKTAMWHSSKIRKGGSDGFGKDAYSLLYIGGTYGVVKHENPGAPLKRRVLIIGDSFARPLEAFLSTIVTDLIALDQRRFASDETVAGFVDSFKPQVVLQVNNPSTFNADSLLGAKKRHPAMFDYGELK